MVNLLQGRLLGGVIGVVALGGKGARGGGESTSAFPLPLSLFTRLCLAGPPNKEPKLPAPASEHFYSQLSSHGSGAGPEI